jgi:PKD repeat protein
VTGQAVGFDAGQIQYPASTLAQAQTDTTSGGPAVAAQYELDWDPGDGSGVTKVEQGGGEAVTIGPRYWPVTTGYSHTYLKAGTYHPTLTVHGEFGTYEVQGEVVVKAGANAKLGASSTSGWAGRSVSFDASSSTPYSGDTITDYSWDFGDPSSSDDTQDTNTVAQASHTYTTPGTYTVTVTVTDSDGVLTTAKETATVTGPPMAVLAGPSGTVVAGSLVSFDASASLPGVDTSITDYSWDFGDSSSSDDTKDTNTVAQASYTYAKAGTYTVTVTVMGADGETNQTAAKVTVTGVPTAALAASSTSAQVGSSVSFDASGSQAGVNTSVTSYGWSFGDGQSATTSTPTTSHTYGAAGSYTVKLTVTDADGQTATKSTTVTITAASTPPAKNVAPPSVAPKASAGSNGVVKLSVSLPSSQSATRVSVQVKTALAVVIKPARKGHKATKRVLSLGATSLSLAPGHKRSLQVKLNATGKKLLAKQKTLRVHVVVTAKNAAGKVKTQTLTVTLRAAKAKKKAKLARALSTSSLAVASWRLRAA